MRIADARLQDVRFGVDEAAAPSTRKHRQRHRPQPCLRTRRDHARHPVDEERQREGQRETRHLKHEDQRRLRRGRIATGRRRPCVASHPRQMTQRDMKREDQDWLVWLARKEICVEPVVSIPRARVLQVSIVITRIGVPEEDMVRWRRQETIEIWRASHTRGDQSDHDGEKQMNTRRRRLPRFDPFHIQRLQELVGNLHIELRSRSRSVKPKKARPTKSFSESLPPVVPATDSHGSTRMDMNQDAISRDRSGSK